MDAGCKSVTNTYPKYKFINAQGMPNIFQFVSVAGWL